MEFQLQVDASDIEAAWGAMVMEFARGTVRGLVMGLKEGEQAALSTGRWKDRTGETRRNTRGTVDFLTVNGGAGQLNSLVKHASFLEEGTKPHLIRPKEGAGFVGPLQQGQSRRGKTDIGTHRVALRWHDDGGQVHFARVVHHPGTQATGYMAAGVQQLERTFLRELEVSVAKAQSIADRY
jgi:hypothetical protein